MPEYDAEVQRIINAADPGVLDVAAAYERIEPSYMAAARVHQGGVITVGINSVPAAR